MDQWSDCRIEWILIMSLPCNGEAPQRPRRMTGEPHLIRCSFEMTDSPFNYMFFIHASSVELLPVQSEIQRGTAPPVGEQLELQVKTNDSFI